MQRPVHAGVSDDLDLLSMVMEPAEGRRYLSVSAHGAGEAALMLAAAGADEVLAYDIGDGPMLARLVELKASSAALFGREDHLVLMGLRPASALRKKALTRQLLLGLDARQHAYWAPRARWLEEGLFRADQIGRFFQLFVSALRLLAPEPARAQMLTSPSATARLVAYQRYVARPWLRRALDLIGRRVNLFFPRAEWAASEYPKLLNRDPLGYLERLIESGLSSNPLFAHYVLDPELPFPAELLPPQLRAEGFDGLRRNAGRVRVWLPPTGTTELRLPVVEGLLDGAYLSNVVDYLGPAERLSLFEELMRTLKPEAPILLYSNEAFPKVPLEAGLVHDEALSRRLASADRARIYARIEVYRGARPTGAVKRLKVVE
jgi:S-adenosylmethionine:diacylglycerol 3-amino-3-carboxypropyl transferase